ncbi:MAG: ATP-dependent Clp protease proteolytic subunit [Clostridia bacterium]|nr:ATP-dependent Clp protease proteolytic subunit [Clostridia bacterium]
MSEKSSSIEKENEKLEMIEKSGGVKEDRIYCLNIIGQIEGHYILSSEQKSTKYEHIIPLLVSIEQSKEIEGLLIILNTMGGDVEAGLAIAEMIASMKKPSVSLVLGGGHSIGVPLAVCADRSFIVPSATMTIHPVRISGTVVGSPQTYYHFERMQDRITKFVSLHSKITEDAFKELMMRTDQIATDTGSIIDGYEAQRCGLIDSVGGLSEALATLTKLMDQKK